MAKQKIAVKVPVCCEKKSRKALKIAVSISGVESASFIGSDKDQIVVTGEGIDSVKLTTLLRKGVGNTELLSVGQVEEKKPETKKTKPEPAPAKKSPEPVVVPLQINPYQYCCNCYCMPYYYPYCFIH